MNSKRPDFSNYLAHFTADRAPVCAETSARDEFNGVADLSARGRLIQMLQTGRILASRMPWINAEAVCFTECPWSSLLDHAKRYSPYGIGFIKPRVFAAGGAPVYYVRQDHYQKQQWHPDLHAFVTPFWPSYRPKNLKGGEYLAGKDVDYSHEREWRVPHDFTFKLEQVEFVVVNSYEDVARFPAALKDKVGRDKFLMMDAYRAIERLWPVHNL